MKNCEISHILNVSVSAICDVYTKYKQRGTLEGNYSGRQPKITPEQKQAIFELVEQQPYITIEEIIETLKLLIKKSRVSKILIDNKIFLKKKAIHASEQRREDVVEDRKNRVNEQSSMNSKSLFYSPGYYSAAFGVDEDVYAMCRSIRFFVRDKNTVTR